MKGIKFRSVGVMERLDEKTIRASFVNCSRGEASRLPVPRDLGALRWDDLDFLGWRDPQAPLRGYLVGPDVAGVWRGVVLRASDSRAGVARRSICDLCLTARTGGVALLVAPRAGKAGQRGDSVGTYLCEDLQCSLYVRGVLSTGSVGMHETLPLEQRVQRLTTNVATFLERVR